MISENDGTKNLFDNKYILLFIIIVISIASFYGGTYYSNLFNNYEERYTAIIEEMEQDLLYQNITITSLNNKLKVNINFLRFIKNILIFIALSRIKNYFVSLIFY